MSLTELKRKEFLYQPCYCEENIWHLCQHSHLKNSQVIFIASKGDSFPMLNQRAMQNQSSPILWDYHVVLLVEAETNQILDFDTTLPFCTDVQTYFSQSFISDEVLEVEYRPWFRIIPTGEYVELFSSNRSHMKTESGWLAPPPAWPLIGKSVNNLSEFINMNKSGIGAVLSTDELLARFQEA